MVDEVRQDIHFLEVTLRIARDVLTHDPSLVEAESINELSRVATRRHNTALFRGRKLVGDEVVMLSQCLRNVLSCRAAGARVHALRWAKIARAFEDFIKADLAQLEALRANVSIDEPIDC